MPGAGRYGGRDHSNNQQLNMVLHYASTVEERGLPAVGKIVYQDITSPSTVQVCVDTDPDPTIPGGGTWVDIGTFGGGSLGTISYVGGGAATYAAATTITPTLPGVSLEDGDLLLCAVAASRAAGAVTPSFPGGWQTHSHHTGAGNRHMLRSTLYRTGMANPTLTFTAAPDVAYAQIFAYRGHRRSDPRLQAQDDFSNSLYLPGTVQSTAQSVIQNPAGVVIGETGRIAPAGFLLVNFVVFYGTAAGVSVTTANGFTQRGVSTTTTGTDLSVGFADKIDCDTGDNIAGWPIWTLASGTAVPSVIGDVIAPANG